jgi:hypothetical protein
MVDNVCDELSTIQDSLTAYKSVEICRFFLVSDGFRSELLLGGV